MSEDPRVYPSAQQAFLLTLMQVPQAQILAGPPGEKATEKPGEAQGEEHACPRVPPEEDTCPGIITGRGSHAAGGDVNDTVCLASCGTSRISSFSPQDNL